MTSLEYPDEALQMSSLDGIYALIFDAPDVMATYVPSVIPKLLHLAQQAVTMVIMKQWILFHNNFTIIEDKDVIPAVFRSID